MSLHISEAIEEFARVLWAENPTARKSWDELSERTKNRYRRAAERELSEVFCNEAR